jgi:hypothetical protein
MPLSSIDCRANAETCLRLAKSAAKPEHAQMLRNIAQTWLHLSDELERRISSVLNGREPIVQQR